MFIGNNVNLWYIIERKDNISTFLILLYFSQFFNVSMDYLVGRFDTKNKKNKLSILWKFIRKFIRKIIEKLLEIIRIY